MSKINLTQNKFVLVDDEDFEYLNQWKWMLGKGGYAYRREYLSDGKHGFKSIYMHRLLNNTPEGFITDHINRDKLDNRKSNLRSANKSLNTINRGLLKTNKSGVKGVFFRKDTNKYMVFIEKNGKRHYLGCYSSIEDAHTARSAAEGIYHAI